MLVAVADAREAILSLLDFMVPAVQAAAAMALYLSTTLLRALEQPILAAAVAAAGSVPVTGHSAVAVMVVQV